MAVGTIDEYAKILDDWRGEVVGELDALIRRAAPGATGSIKWAQPVYELHGPYAYVKAFSSAVNFGFWRGSDLSDRRARLRAPATGCGT